MANIKILIAAHKPFKVPEGKYFVPIHVGRKIATSLSKDGKINETDYEWLLKNALGDETGDNISDKNRFYSWALSTVSQRPFGIRSCGKKKM